jgi:hypothetical protein
LLLMSRDWGLSICHWVLKSVKRCSSGKAVRRLWKRKMGIEKNLKYWRHDTRMNF